MMTTIRRLGFALALLPLLAACPKMQGRAETTPGADVSAYQSYRWITDDLGLIQEGQGDKLIRSAENEQRIRAAVDRGLAAKGLAKAEGDAASLVVAFSLGTKMKYTVQPGSYEAEQDEPPATYHRARLRVYLFDASTGKQVWQGWATRNINGQEDPDAEVNAAVDLILAKFPG